MNVAIEAPHSVCGELLQQLAQLTRLTRLQLNTAYDYVKRLDMPDEGWAQCNTQSLGRLKRGLKDPFCRACIPYIEVMQVALRTRFGLGGGNGAYHHPAYAQVTREMTGRITSVI